MELHELQKMISIIHDKKPKCRGNLRVKVLLKSTHDYVRQSLIDDQLGNPESLTTLLRNSGTGKQPVNSELETDLHSKGGQTSSTVQTDSDAMDCDEVSKNTSTNLNGQELLNESSRSVKHLSDNMSATNKTFSITDDDDNVLMEDVSETSDCGESFRNSDKDSQTIDKHAKRKYLKLTKALRQVLKHWDLLMSVIRKDNSYLKRHYHSIKKTKKLLLECKMCFKSDFENQSFSQQKMIQSYLKVIKNKLKQCDSILDYKCEEFFFSR